MDFAEQIPEWFSAPAGGLSRLRAQTRENLPRMPAAYAAVMEQEPDEQALMAAYAAGDERAFDTLFRLLAPRLLAFFRRSISDPALCEDLLQTTFVRLHAARDRYRTGSPLRPWLFTIAARVRIDELRRRHRRPTSTSEEEIERLEAEADPDRGGLGIDRQARVHSVRDALDALPPAQRMVVHLHRFEGLSFAQIG
ncbi:MAG TPA: RNA polymerase sigma factor, partial [Polyangiales bacterium]